MSERYERVEPTPFDAAPAAAEAGTGAAAGSGRPALALPALALLIVAALFVFLALPRLVDEREPAVEVASGAEAEAPAAADPRPTAERPAASDPAASPYADALEARARAEAQELLGELIDVRENLEARGALDWATQAMEEIGREAAEGDERYRERAFEAAIGHYRQALDDAIALEASLPERFAAELAATDAAIEDLDPEQARASLARAAQIEPGAPELAPRDTRTAALPAVIEAFERAVGAEGTGDLEAAVAALEEARDLDREHQRVSAELQRVRSALNDQRFAAAMSEGYAALDDAAFDRAGDRFDAAGRLRPGSAEAAAALEELAVARTVARLAALQERSEALTADEDWSAAIEVFEEALSVDASLRFAREGLAQARPRAEIDKSLEAIIDEPGRLVDDAILGEARASLERALDVTDRGPRLEAQIRKVGEIISIASTPLPVRLTSDGQTAVTVYKVARLGAFSERELELRPGVYTAVGTRRGFRDVRVEFTVAPDRSGAVHIACSEAI